jgi:hypothetical protein
VAGPGAIEVQNGETFSWSGGTLGSGSADSGAAVLEVRSGGIANYSGGLLNGRRVNNAGTFNANNVLSLANSAVVNNTGTYNINLAGNTGTFGNSVAGSSFINSGLLNKTNSSGVVSFELPLTNLGTVHVAVGTFDLLGGGTNSGTFSSAAWCSSALREQLLAEQHHAACWRGFLCRERRDLDARFRIAAPRRELLGGRGDGGRRWRDRGAGTARRSAGPAERSGAAALTVAQRSSRCGPAASRLTAVAC